MLVKKEDIHRFIPQRNPIIMIGDLLEASENHAITETLIEADNLFCIDGKLSEPGLVENIAQTAAAQAGYQCQIKNIPVPVGFIASIKDLGISKLPPVNARISTRIEITNQVFDVTIFKASVQLNDEVICSGEMRVFIKNENN